MRMPTYLYCLRTDRAHPPDGLTGVDGAMVHAVDVSGLMAWVSDVAEGVAPTVDRLRAHDAVCAAALAAGDHARRRQAVGQRPQGAAQDAADQRQ